MPKLEELLREELRAAAPTPAPAEDIFERLGTRKRRRTIARRAMSGVLAVAVLAATAGAFVALDRAFKGGEDEIANPPALKENGDLLVSVPGEGGSHIYRLPADSIPGPGEVVPNHGDLDPVWFEEGPAEQLGASVSPDGLRIVFEDPDVDGGALWSVGIDGSNPTRLTERSLDASQPAWSPDGQKIAFVGTDEARDRRIFVMNADGSSARAVTNGEILFPSSPTWSPDGARIAFTGVEGPITDVGPRIILTVSTDGSSPARIEGPLDVGDGVAWSPDGRHIAYVDSGIKLLDLETEEVRTLTDPVAEDLPGASTGDAYDTDPAWSPDGTLVVFSRFDRVDHSVVYAVRADGSGLPYPLVVGRNPAWQPLPSAQASPEPTSYELGLAYPTCRVTSMPITTAGGGTAYVFTEAPGGDCPKRGEGVSRAGVDLDEDGTVDATTDPFKDCFFLCEAFAAADVNADGIPEIAISTQGTDGYGVWLYSFSTDPVAMSPIDVSDPDGIGYLTTGPLEFAWVGAAAHREDAVCTWPAEGSPTFVVRSTDVRADDAVMRTTTLLVVGDQATVIAADSQTIPLSAVPGPGNEICGSPLYNSAADFPGAHIEGDEIGLERNLCQTERLGGLELVPGAPADVAWTGYLVNAQGKCPRDTGAQEWIVAIDVTGDGLADASTTIPLINCPYVYCWPLGGTDLDADGDQELVVTTGFSESGHGYFAVEASDSGFSISPIVVAAPGHPAAGIDPGEPLQTSAGGDEGYASWVRCQSFPTAPVLVYTNVSGVVDPQPDSLDEWHEVWLRLESDGMFHVVDATDLTLPWDQDPNFELATGPSCGGIDFSPLGG